MKKTIDLKVKILSKNDDLAKSNSELLKKHSVLGINVMASPGAGKTSVIMKMIGNLKKKYKIGVIEGDVVMIDVLKIKKSGVQVVLANTGGACHLDALMIEKALKKIKLQDLDVLIVENVGNLICPMNFKLGTNLNVVIASVPEGADKPYKYPGMFKGADLVLLNKSDYLDQERFDVDYFCEGVKKLNQDVKIYPVSCRNGQGFDKLWRFFENWMDRS